VKHSCDGNVSYCLLSSLRVILLVISTIYRNCMYQAGDLRERKRWIRRQLTTALQMTASLRAQVSRQASTPSTAAVVKAHGILGGTKGGVTEQWAEFTMLWAEPRAESQIARMFTPLTAAVPVNSPEAALRHSLPASRTTVTRCRLPGLLS